MSRIRFITCGTASRLRRTGCFLALGAVVLHVSAVAALAQRPGRTPNEDGGTLQWFVLIGAGVVICLTGFLNSKRSHLN